MKLFYVTPFLRGSPTILKYKDGVLVTKVKGTIPRKISKKGEVFIYGTIQNRRFYAEEIRINGRWNHKAQFVKTWCGSNGFYTVKNFSWNGLFYGEKISKKFLKKKLAEARKMHSQSIEGLIVRRDEPTRKAYAYRGSDVSNVEDFNSRYAKAGVRRVRR